MATTQILGTKKTPIRFSFVHVFEPSSMQEGGQLKYSTAILIDKDDKETLRKVKEGVDEATAAFKAKNAGKLPRNFKTPLRDGDDERPDDATYENKMFLNASSNNRPGVVDTNREELMSNDEFYSGCFGRAAVNFYPFDVSGNKGVACGLNHVQKTAEGERLSGGLSVEDAFKDEEDDLL